MHECLPRRAIRHTECQSDPFTRLGELDVSRKGLAINVDQCTLYPFKMDVSLRSSGGSRAETAGSVDSRSGSHAE